MLKLKQDLDPGLDPLNYRARRRELAEVINNTAKALAKLLESLDDKLAAEAHKFTPKTDKKLVTYTASLRRAITTVHGELADAERDYLSDLDDAYKTRLRNSLQYQAVGEYGGQTEPFADDLRRALDKAEAAGTIARAVDILTTGSGGGPSRSYSTALGPWLNIIDKFFPALAKSVYAGDAQAEFMRGTWVQLATQAEISDRLKKMAKPLPGTDQAAKERAAVREMVKQYNKDIDKAEELGRHIQQVWHALQAAAN